jgi:hypothetical protein
MNKQTFKQWMHATYDREELQGIAEHGCVSGVSGMIYYSETCDLYDTHAEELHDLLYQYEQDFGQYPQYIVENLGCLTGFKNAMIWFAAEFYAQEMTNEELESEA